MTLISVKEFMGIIPKLAPHNLPDQAAQTAENVRFNAKQLQPWYQTTEEENLINTSEVKTIFLYEDIYWFEWTADVNIILAPLASDATGKAYYTGDGIPKKTNRALATTGGAPMPNEFYPMGLPVPNEEISAVNTGGGSGDDRYIQYVWTVVSTWMEESSPSPPMASALLAKQGDTVNLSNIQMKWEAGKAYTLNDSVYPTASEGGTYLYKCVQAGTSGGTEPSPWGTTIDEDTADNTCLWRCYKNNLLYKRIYRYNTGDDTANYQFLQDIAVTNTTYSDAGILDADLGQDISEEDYDPPPDAMMGICYMGNGICVAFSGKDLYFSMPYKPWAYPLAYQKTIPVTIVSLIPIGEAVIVATEGNPYLVTGNDPSAISVSPIPFGIGCTSKRGCATWGVLALIPAVDGLYAVAGGQVQNLLKEHFDTKTWAEFMPTTYQATVWDNKYIAMFSYGATEGAIIVDLLSGQVTTLDFYSSAIYRDPKTGTFYYVYISNEQMITAIADRDFSAASNWVNVDLSAYDETGDLTITASGIGQYCTLPVVNAPMEIGHRYRLTFNVANLVSTWSIKSFDGTQTIGSVTSGGSKTYDFTATATGGLRIVSLATDSSGDFDNFSLLDITQYVYQWEGDTTLVYGNYTWKTKTFVFPYRKVFKAARLVFESNDLAAYYAELLAYDEAVERNRARISALLGGQSIGDITPGTPVSLGGDLLEELPTIGAYSGEDTLTLKTYVDGILKSTVTVLNDKPFLLGANTRGRKWEFQIEGNVTVKRFDVADSIAELKEGK